MIQSDVALQDPSSLESEVGPSGLKRTPPLVTTEEQALFKLTMERFNSAATDRRPFEAMVFESWAMYLGNQGETWNASSRKLSARKVRSPHRIVQHRNKIRPKIKKGLATALRNDPDVTVAPWTASQQDRGTAIIGRSIKDHYTIAFRNKQALWEMSRWAWTTSTCRRKYWWNPKAWAEIPTGLDDDGNATGSTIGPVGNICVDVVPWTEYYGDPRARSEDEQRWCIHAKQLTLGEWQENYDDGWMVDGGNPEGMRGLTESATAAVIGGYPRGQEIGQNNGTQTMYEVWERPGKEYPKGRWWTCSGDGRTVTKPADLPVWLRRLTDGGYDLPFNPLAFELGQGNLHGANAVWDLVGAQRAYNDAVSRVSEWLRTMFGKILACEGSQISTSAFDSAKDNEVVYWHPNPGGPPTHLPAPDLPSFVMEMLELAEKDMQDMAGVHEVSNGQVPSQVTAASAIKLLQDSDTTQIADFTQNLEAFVEKDADYILRIARAYFKEPRLLFMSQTKGSKTNAVPRQSIPSLPNIGNPNSGMAGMPTAGDGGQGMVGGAQAQAGLTAPGMPPQQQGPVMPTPDDGLPAPIMQAQTFEAFAGGSMRVRVTPGSATPKSPEANAELVLDLHKQGVFNPQTTPPDVAKAILEELEIMDPNFVFEAMIQWTADTQARALALQPPPPDPIQQAEQQAKIMAIMEAVKLHSAVTFAQAKATAEAEGKAMDLHVAMQMKQLEAHLNQWAPPATSIAAKLTLGPTAAPSAEKLMGLEPDNAADAKAISMPPKTMPKPTNGAKPNGTSSQS